MDLNGILVVVWLVFLALTIHSLEQSIAEYPLLRRLRVRGRPSSLVVVGCKV